MNFLEIKTVIFLAISLLTVFFGCVVAFSKNLVRSAFALLGVFAGVFGLYVLLSADFVAIIQLVIYIGGILVLILFAIMLTSKIEASSGKKFLVNKAVEPLPAIVGTLIVGALIVGAILRTRWQTFGAERFAATTSAIGNKLLREYLLPFELVSLILVLVLVGAIVLARREVK